MKTHTESGFALLSEVNAAMINAMVNVVNDWAIKKGWNENQADMDERHLRMYKAEKIALMHTELSECLEYLRNAHKVACPHCHGTRTHLAEPRKEASLWSCDDCATGSKGNTFWGPAVRPSAMDDKVPTLTGEGAELADTLIRIFHYAGEFGINLGECLVKKHEFNCNRPFRHGKLS